MNKKLYSFTFLLSQYSSLLYAQDYLFDSDTEIASHKRQASSHSFQKESPGEGSTFVGYLFKPGDNDPYKDLDDKILIYNGLPKCEESKVILDEVFQHSEGSEAIDFIVYDYKDSAQAKLASTGKRVTIPWDPNYDTGAGHMTVDAKMQDLARVMNPGCLPTSFRYIYSGSKRYLEAKTGKKAWE